MTSLGKNIRLLSLFQKFHIRTLGQAARPENEGCLREHPLDTYHLLIMSGGREGMERQAKCSGRWDEFNMIIFNSNGASFKLIVSFSNSMLVSNFSAEDRVPWARQGWPRRAEAPSLASRLAPRAERSASAPRRLGASGLTGTLCPAALRCLRGGARAGAAL